MLSRYAYLHRLTPVENQIAHAIARGDSPREIAECRGVSVLTVRTQIKSIYSKTGAHSRVRLALLARNAKSGLR
jgi:DNA-binding CsgD family transcriptional regulator